MVETVQITLQFIAGSRHTATLPSDTTVAEIQELASCAFGPLRNPPKLVHRGAALPEGPQARVTVREGDVILVVPHRPTPNAKVVAAVTGEDKRLQQQEDDDDAPAQLPPGAPKWEVQVINSLQRSRICSDWLLEWLVIIRPYRILVLLLFLAGCVISSRINLGPIFILTSIIVFICTNLGRRKQGEASAYSIFNEGVRRLPGQLDADEVDRQMRRGQI